MENSAPMEGALTAGGTDTIPVPKTKITLLSFRKRSCLPNDPSTSSGTYRWTETARFKRQRAFEKGKPSSISTEREKILVDRRKGLALTLLGLLLITVNVLIFL